MRPSIALPGRLASHSSGSQPINPSQHPCISVLRWSCDLMTDREELDLIKSFLGVRDGDRSPEEQKAWGDFFLVHEGVIQNLIKHCAHWRADEDDIFQEVWLALIRKLQKLKYDPKRGPLRAWVIVVARNAATKAARRLRRNGADALAPELAAVLLDPGPDPVTQLEQEQERQWVRSILATLGAKLSDLSHQVMVLYWIEERSMPEIAAALSLSEDRVRMRLQRALKKLRVLSGASLSQKTEK
jgi:RNA polymerase sigma factor (sigma-70 family)